MIPPSVGRIVMHRGISSNAAIDHPAIITRVWSDVTVNLTIFPDNGSPECKTSVMLLADPKAEDAYTGWYWPIKVPAEPAFITPAPEA